MAKFPFENPILLENYRVRLSPLSQEHHADLLPIAMDQNLLLYSPSAINSSELLTNYIQAAIHRKEEKNSYAFAIFDKQAGRLAGSTRFGNVSEENDRLEIGWTWIGPKFQGTGLNKACKFLLLDFAFNHLGFERVELKSDARNLRSRKAMEKIGAQYEGLLRHHVLMGDGHRRDTVYYSILKREWARLKSERFGEFL